VSGRAAPPADLNDIDALSCQLLPIHEESVGASPGAESNDGPVLNDQDRIRHLAGSPLLAQLLL